MILCCGEALIDMVPVDPNADQVSYAPLAGGAIFNTARALGRLEVPVKFLSGVSRDMFGQQLVAELTASNVETDLLVRSDRPTTLAFVKLTNGQAQYTFYDENSAGRMIAPQDVSRIPGDVTALYFGGISLCAEPAATTYEDIALRHAQSMFLMLDPNIRSGFIEDEAAYRARLDRMIAVADVVKVSDEDLDWICPGSSGEDAKAAVLQQLGAKVIILTKGSAGAVAYKGNEEIARVDVPKVDVVDTVGAGDTFNAGFMAHLQKTGGLTKTSFQDVSNSDIASALDFAAKVAAITVSRAGANPPHLSELEL